MYFRSKGQVVLLYILVGVVQSCASFLLLISIGEFFTIHYHAGNSKGRLLQLLGLHFKALHAFFLFFSLLLLVKTVFDFWERWLSYQQGERYVKFIREKVFATQLGWNPERFQRKHFGMYLLRYTNDMKNLQNYFTKGIMGCIKDICFLSMGFFLLWIVNPRLAACLLLITLITMSVIFIVSRAQRKLIRKSRGKRSSVLAFVTESFQQHASIIGNNTLEKSEQRFNKLSGQLYVANMKNNRFESMLQALLPLFQFSAIGLLLWLMTLSISLIRHSDALVFLLITMMLISPVRRILKVPAIRNKGKISLRKINEILEAQDMQRRMGETGVSTKKACHDDDK